MPLTGDVPFKPTLNHHILLFQADPSECSVRPWLGIEYAPQHQAKPNLFFPLCNIQVLSQREFILFTLSNIFKHWFGSGCKWDWTDASARFFGRNCSTQHKHSHPQKRTQNPNIWLWSPRELGDCNSPLFFQGIIKSNSKNGSWKRTSHHLLILTDWFL